MIILTRAGASTDPADLLKSTIDELTKRFGAKNITPSDAKISLNGTKQPCVDLGINLLETKLRDRVLTLQTKQGVYLVVVQDTLNDDGSVPEDGNLTLQLLDKTLKMN